MSDTRYASVTSLTGLLPKNLVWWAGNTVAQCAVDEWDEIGRMDSKEEAYDYLRRAHQRVSSKAMDLGSEVHRYAEAYHLGKPMPTPPLPVKAYLDQLARFFYDWRPEVIAAETKVYHRNTRGQAYAGTLDLLVKIDGETAVVDIKTGRNVWPEAALQINAYAYADFLIADPNHPGAIQHTPGRGRRWYEWHGPPADEVEMPDVEAGYVLHLRPDGYSLLPVPIEDRLYDLFLSLFRVLEWEDQIKKTALGAALPKPIFGSSDVPTTRTV